MGCHVQADIRVTVHLCHALDLLASDLGRVEGTHARVCGRSKDEGMGGCPSHLRACRSYMLDARFGVEGYVDTTRQIVGATRKIAEGPAAKAVTLSQPRKLRILEGIKKIDGIHVVGRAEAVHFLRSSRDAEILFGDMCDMLGPGLRCGIQHRSACRLAEERHQERQPSWLEHACNEVSAAMRWLTA